MGMLMTLLFSVSSTQPVYLRGVPVYLTIALSNTGNRPVELTVPPGPCVYSLTPPGSPSAVQQEGPAPLGEPGQTPHTLAPGERWEGLVDLQSLFGLEENGVYKVSAELPTGELPLRSAPQEFRIEDLRVTQLTFGHRGGPEAGNASLLFFRAKDAGKVLMISSASMADIPDGGPAVTALHEHLPLPAEATDPVTATTPAVMQLTWHFWREGSTLCGLRGSETFARKLVLPGSVQRLLEPALLDPDSLTHLFALSTKDGKPTLVVARIMDYLKDPKDRERVLAERTLDAMPDATAAMIDGVNGKPRRALVLARMAGPLPKFDWMSYSGDVVPAALRTHAWTKMISAEKIADSQPALHGFPEGGLRFAWIVREAGKPKQGLLCEATFDETGALKSESMTSLTTESPIKAARIVYGGGAPVVALWTEDGKILGGRDGDLQVVVPKSPGRLPPTFILLHTTPLVLDFDPVKGMVLVPTR